MIEHIVFILIGGTNYDTTHSHESASSPTAVNITTEKPNPYANKTICYAYVGCFDNFPPFDNANLDLPRSPEEIGTEFLLYTRRNWNNSQHLNYSSLTSITNSFYKSSLKTKIIIHGFTNSIKSTWLYAMKNALLTKVSNISLKFLLSNVVLNIVDLNINVREDQRKSVELCSEEYCHCN